MKVKLSARLKAVADMIPKCDRLADIGTDHGYLPIYCVQNKLCQSAIAGDVAYKPCQQGERQVAKYNLHEHVKIRCGSGLTVLKQKEVDGVVIAGVGGNTIVQILNESPSIVNALDFLVLQPQSDYQSVLFWLENNSWLIEDESLVLENNLIYQVLRARRGTMKIKSYFEAKYGPINLKKKTDILFTLIEQDLQHYQRIKEQVKSSSTSSDRLKEINEWIKELERNLNVLEKK